MKHLTNYPGKLIIVLLLVSASGFFLIRQKRKALPAPAVTRITDQQIQDIFNSHIQKKLIKKPYVNYSISVADGSPAGQVYHSEDLGINIHGYKSKIKLFLIMDNNKKIKKIILDDIKETPEYVNKIKRKGLLEQWQDSPMAATPPDSITGATQTSNAINKTITAMLQRIQ